MLDGGWALEREWYFLSGVLFFLKNIGILLFLSYYSHLIVSLILESIYHAKLVSLSLNSA